MRCYEEIRSRRSPHDVADVHGARRVSDVHRLRRIRGARHGYARVAPSRAAQRGWHDQTAHMGHPRGLVQPMKAIVPGHEYDLDCLDSDIPTVEILHFVKRVGSKYPGNCPPARHGTTTQEVIRALIDRTKYVDAQIDRTTEVSQDGHETNKWVITHLQCALRLLEERAASERGDWRARLKIGVMTAPELEPTCAGCGHLLCAR